MSAFLSKVAGLGGFIWRVGIAGFHHNAVVAAAATATTATAARERPVFAASMMFAYLTLVAVHGASMAFNVLGT